MTSYKKILDLAKKLDKTKSKVEQQSLFVELEQTMKALRPAELDSAYVKLIDFEEVFEFASDRYNLNYRMNESNNCSAYGCDDYCRCGRINYIEEVSCVMHDLTLPPEATEIQQLLSLHYLNRVLMSLDSSGGDDFEWNAVGGYYGEELDYIRANRGSHGWLQVERRIEDWNKAKSDNERVDLFLLEEYGRLIVHNATYQVKDLLLSDIDATEALAGDPPVNIQFKNNLKQSSSLKELVGLIVIKQPGTSKYKLIDGRHRYLAIKELLGKKISKPHNVKCIVVV